MRTMPFSHPKLHALQHFIHDVHSGGTPENCSTETPESLHIQMCKDPYEASHHCDYDEQILSYLDIQDHLSMHSAYEDYRERERIEVSKPFFVCCNVTKLMAIENEHSHVENGAGPQSMEQLHTCNGGSISGLPLTIKITQDPHHHACPIEQVIQCKWYNSELGSSNYYTTFSVSKGVIQRKRSPGQV